MTYTETQLEAIRLFGRKDLSFGCLIYATKIDNYFYIAGKINGEPYVVVYRRGEPKIIFLKDNEGDFEILGHIPHLEDLFRVVEEKGYNIIGHGDRFGCTIYSAKRALDDSDKDYKEVEIKLTLPLLDQPNLSDIISLFR